MAKVSISQIPRKVAEFTGQPAPSPRVVYDRVLRGDIEAELINGRWMWDPATTPETAAALGLNQAAAVA